MGFVVALFAILIIRLFHLQIVSSHEYSEKSKDNRIDRISTKALRGLIFARGGETLVRNGAFYTISLARTTQEEFHKTVAAIEQAIGGPPIVANYSPHRSVRLKRDVDFRTVSIVEELLREDWPIAIEIEAKRVYPAGKLAAHVIGHMGFVPEGDQSAKYLPGDFIGRTGVEGLFESRLRGKDGVQLIEVDARQRIQRYFESERLPVSGRNLTLTLDYEVQRAAERALPDSLPGSVVALDARTGAVLAMASKPSFDPNVFVSFQGQEERIRLLQDDNKPILNRATNGTYPPGSTLKLVCATAALETGITDTLSTFEACAGSLRVGDIVFRCFERDGHGELNLLEAVETSCNIYFLHLAQLLGIETWWRFGDKLGFGQSTEIDLPPGDMPGLLPTRDYFERTEGWAQGHLMNLVIGQGSVLVTPLQMARYCAALGNGGLLVTPHVHGSPPPVPVEGVSAATFDIIRKCMYRVVHGAYGTGRRAAIEGVEVAGKSGTAQASNRNDDAWFVAFAPYENPTISVAVVVEGGGGGGAVAAPIARQVMEAYFGINPAGEVARSGDNP